MNTRSYNLWRTFNKLVAQAVDEIEAEINAALGTSYNIDLYIEEPVTTYPSVRTRFLQWDGRDRRHFMARVEMEVYHHDLSDPPDHGLTKLISSSLLEKLGFKHSRDGYYIDHPIQDIFADPSSPELQDPFRLELDDLAGSLKLDSASERTEVPNSTGWRDVPETDPELMHAQILFKLYYRGD
jgi:hypothetical protein